MMVCIHNLKLLNWVTGPQAVLPQAGRLAFEKRSNQHFKIPKKKGFRYTDRPVKDCCHCLKIEPVQAASKRALLFLHGDGHILKPSPKDIKLAGKIGKGSRRDVWYPYHSSCTAGSIKDTFKCVYSAYREMLKEYSPREITVLGFSSGGALAIDICSYNMEQESPLPMPGRVMTASSRCAATEEGKQKMRELYKKDRPMDAAFVSTIQSIMFHGIGAPDYMDRGTWGDFTNAPITPFYEESDKVACAEVPYFAEAYEKFNTSYASQAGKRMCCCNPAFLFYPEGKHAHKKIIKLLNG